MDDDFATLFANCPDRPPADRRARATRRADQWRAGIDKAFAYASGRAKDDAERAAVQAAFSAELKEGPDFIRCRRGSLFMDAPTINMDRNVMARIQWLFGAIARGSWAAERKAKAEGDDKPKGKGKGKGKGKLLITPAAERVFWALLALAKKYDRLFPSLKGLAWLARCCPKTVQTALNILEQLGFIVRHRRLKKVQTALGWRARQNTNGYVPTDPTARGGLGALAVRLFASSDGNYCRASGIKFSVEEAERRFWPLEGVAVRPSAAACP